MFLCKNSSVWLILVSISGRGMTSTGTKDFWMTWPLYGPTCDLMSVKQGVIWLSLFRHNGFRVENKMVVHLGYESSIGKSATVWMLLTWLVTSWVLKRHFSDRSWGGNYMECYKWLYNRYCMCMQAHNLLLKRLKVYLSDILKTLFENKVFDTILSHLCQCFIVIHSFWKCSITIIWVWYLQGCSPLWACFLGFSQYAPVSLHSLKIIFTGKFN